VPIVASKPFSLISNVRAMLPQPSRFLHIKVINQLVSKLIEIQSALVELEDKEKNIIGSN